MNNPCENCVYHWQESWERFPSCHYLGPHEWAPCEAEDEADRIRREKEEEDEEKERIILDDLASKLDKFYSSFDPYTYAEYEGNYEKTRQILKEDPLAVVSDLLRIAEDYTA